jgi:predicted tellurium resistance membrane protein TerC
MDHVAVALIALIAMEIVLGIDNIVFIALLTSRLPEKQRNLGRSLGLMFALATRLLLLVTLVWITQEDGVFSRPLFTLGGLGIHLDKATEYFNKVNVVDLRDLILLAGGLFLIGKSVHEIHGTVEGDQSSEQHEKPAGMLMVLVQVAVLDIVFSLDSVITAVGMAKDLWVMITAVVVSVGVMLIFAKRISDFIEENPTLKMLALSFLILVGVVLVSDAVGMEINKGYIYFAMAFSIVVEILNIRIRGVGQSESAGDIKEPAPAQELPPAADQADQN